MPSTDKIKDRLEKLDLEKAELKGQLDRDRLMAATNTVIETITSPEFVEKMRHARDEAEKDGGYEAVAKILSLEGLRAAGAKIPEDFRLTSRIFEDKVKGERFEISPINDPDGPLQPYDPLGWGACAGGGAATICGCGGFST